MVSSRFDTSQCSPREWRWSRGRGRAGEADVWQRHWVRRACIVARDGLADLGELGQLGGQLGEFGVGEDGVVLYFSRKKSEFAADTRRCCHIGTREWRRSAVSNRNRVHHEVIDSVCAARVCSTAKLENVGVLQSFHAQSGFAKGRTSRVFSNTSLSGRPVSHCLSGSLRASGSETGKVHTKVMRVREWTNKGTCKVASRDDFSEAHTGGSFRDETPGRENVSLRFQACMRVAFHEVNLSNPVTAVKPPGSDTPPSTESRDDGEEEVLVELVEDGLAGAWTANGSTST